MEVILWIVAGIGVLGLILAGGRFVFLRSRGTNVVLRRLPAEDAHGWRHGTLQYNGDDLQYFKLRSVLPAPDRVFVRSQVSFSGHRRPTAEEETFFSEGTVIVTAETKGEKLEFALDRHGAMALIAWIESAPPENQVRENALDLWTKTTRGRGA